ncbi:MAG: aryl-sulfate sulfotransferase [Ginsengibacter sp.]
MYRIIINIIILFTIAGSIGCHYKDGNIIKEVHIGLHNNNELKIQLDVSTIKKADLYAEYWADSIKKDIFKAADILNNGLSHRIVMCDIIPETNYSYRLITNQNGKIDTSKTYTFKSVALPIWLTEQFKASCNHPELLPTKFKEGFMLLNKKEMPGIVYIADYTGRLRWYHVIDNTGLKVVHFTKDKTILAILGSNDEPTSYGSEILEINMLGDTLLHLKKGQSDFVNTIHHEILRNDRRQLVTIFEDNKIFDLSSVGGTSKDTVSSDGIIVMDSTGKKVWQWSVFDVLDPLKDPNILKDRKDWTHANSLNYDKDSNYIISFYNTGQIWKVDAKSGKIIWKYGKGGDFKIPADGQFSESHAVHINANGNLMFFDNGVPKEQSQVIAMKLDEQNKTAKTVLHIELPPQIYNARMGSGYLIDDNHILCCCSKRHIAVLTNRDGKLLWTLDMAVPPYRVEFLTKNQVAPWLQP